MFLAYALPGLVNRAGAVLRVDFSEALRYSKRYCSGTWQLHPEIEGEQFRTRVFLLKGKSLRELFFSHRDLSRRTSYPVRQVSALTEESVMGIIA